MSARRRPDQSQQRATPGRRRPGRRDRFKSYTAELLRTGRLPAFMLSVGLSVILGAFAVSSDFTVESVVIRGNSIAYADSIVERSGALGDSIFHLRSDRVADRVAGHPVVASARVRTELPDRMVIDVVEREPSIVWQVNENAVLVDQYGWVLAEGDAEDLPRVIELDGEMPEPGTSIGATRVEAAQVLWEEFGAEAMVEFEEEDGFSVHLESDRRILLGDVDELPVKVHVAAEVREMDVEWTEMDVRDPDRPYYHE